MAIDLLTYEFLKKYVEGSQMGQYAKPRGGYNSSVKYNTGDYVTHNNTVYIVPFDSNGNSQNFSGIEPGSENSQNYWQQFISASSPVAPNPPINPDTPTNYNSYSKEESDLLINASSILYKNTVTLDGDLFLDKSDNTYYTKKSATNAGSIVFNEAFETIDEYCCYIALKPTLNKLDNSGQYLMLLDIDIEMENSEEMGEGIILCTYSRFHTGGQEEGFTTQKKLQIGKNYIIRPFASNNTNEEKRQYGIYLRNKTKQSIKITVNNVKIFKPLDVTLDASILEDGIEWKHPNLLQNTAPELDIVTELSQKDWLYKASNTILRMYSLSEEQELDLLFYTTFEQNYVDKDTYNADYQAINTNLDNLGSLINTKGIYFKRYSANEKCILNRGSAYFFRGGNGSMNYYREDGTRAISDGDFEVGIAIMPQFRENSNYLPSLLVAPDSSSLNGNTVDLPKDDLTQYIYVKATSEFNVWELRM